MMEDQHIEKLDCFYETIISSAKKYLQKVFSLKDCMKDDPDYPKDIMPDNNWLVWKIEIKHDKLHLNLLVALHNTFPDTFPKIYLSQEDYKKIGQIPHIDQSRYVCTRERSIAVINDKKPGEAIEHLINIAVKEIICRGLKNENFNDFPDEFLAYWDKKSNPKLLSLYSPSEKIERIKMVRLNKTFLESHYMIARTVERAKVWLSHVGVEVCEVLEDALYLPFEMPFSLPLPKTNKDIFDILKKSDKKLMFATGKYFTENESNLLIIFSVRTTQGRTLAAWKHKPWKRNGFRNYSKSPIKKRLLKTSMYLIEKFEIERLDKDRLFIRGSKEVKPEIDKSSVAIIGLGSIGSTLAMSLAKCGVSKFDFIDSDCVMPENIARHLCDFSEADQKLSKIQAVKKRLENKFPHIKCELHDKNVLSMLQNNIKIFNEFDIVVSATANFAVERRLNWLLKKKVLEKPLLFVWLEPFAVAGQILYIHPSNGGCYQCCFDSEGRFQYSVAKKDKSLSKREAGCQSSFTPYSGLDVDSFVIHITRIILTILENQIDSSSLYTWLGDFDFFERLGYKVKDEWYADAPFTIHRHNIKKQNDCMTCENL